MLSGLHLCFKNSGDLLAFSGIASMQMLNPSVFLLDLQIKVRYNESFLLPSDRNLDRKYNYGKTY